MQGMEQIPGERLIGMEKLFVMKNVLSRLSMIMLLSIFLWGCGEEKNNNDIDVDDYVETGDTSVNESDANDKPKERVLATEIPDSVKNREIIVKGLNCGENNVYWIEAFKTDCNLDVESSDEEFEEFVNEFAGKDSVDFEDYGASINYWDEEGQKYLGYYQIYRTSKFGGDISSGSVYVPDDPGYTDYYFFDSTGKYVLCCMFGEPEDVVMRFVEPKVNSIHISVNDDVDEKEASLDSKEDIDRVLDAFHALEAEPIGNQNKDMTECSKKVTFSFELVDGRVLTYDFYDDDYLMRDGVIYRANNNEELVSALLFLF